MDSNLFYFDRDLEKMVRPNVLAFDEPAFALSNKQRLSGERSDSSGFKFLRLKIYGHHNFETYKGCVVVFEGELSKLELKSDTKEIVSYYSYSLELGITEFELFLEEESFTFLSRNSILSISVRIKRTSVFFQITDYEIFNALL